MSSLLPYLTGPLAGLVAALVGVYMFQSGKWHSKAEFDAQAKRIGELEKALATERQAVNEYARTGSTNNQLIDALIQVSLGRRPDGGATPPGPVSGN